MKVLVTGGAGFIGSALCRLLIAETDAAVVNLDKLTYAASPQAIAELAGHPRYRFEKADICDAAALDRIFSLHQPDAVLHLAAESHVDRSIDAPSAFIDTNIVGTFTLRGAPLPRRPGACAARGFSLPSRVDRRGLRLARSRWGVPGDHALRAELALLRQQGGVRPSGARLAPHVRAADGADQLLEHYGPYQHPEKLIPLMITNAVQGRPLPVTARAATSATGCSSTIMRARCGSS